MIMFHYSEIHSLESSPNAKRMLVFHSDQRYSDFKTKHDFLVMCNGSSDVKYNDSDDNGEIFSIVVVKDLAFEDKYVVSVLKCSGPGEKRTVVIDHLESSGTFESSVSSAILVINRHISNSLTGKFLQMNKD